MQRSGALYWSRNQDRSNRKRPCRSYQRSPVWRSPKSWRIPGYRSSTRRRRSRTRSFPEAALSDSWNMWRWNPHQAGWALWSSLSYWNYRDYWYNPGPFLFFSYLYLNWGSHPRENPKYWYLPFLYRSSLLSSLRENYRCRSLHP